MVEKRKSAPRGIDDLTSVEDWLATEDFGEEAKLRAMKRLIAMQLDQQMRAMKMSKAELARQMNTSRAQVDSLLDPSRNVTIESLSRAAHLMGRKVRLELI